MQLQPSTQSWRVIWVRDGIARSCVERELGRLLDQAADLQLVVGEAAVAQRDVVGVARVERAVAAKGRRDVGLAELLRHRRLRRDDRGGGVAQVLRALQRLDEGRRCSTAGRSR